MHERSLQAWLALESLIRHVTRAFAASEGTDFKPQRFCLSCTPRLLDQPCPVAQRMEYPCLDHKRYPGLDSVNLALLRSMKWHRHASL
jgi:hypothetical protein